MRELLNHEIRTLSCVIILLFFGVTGVLGQKNDNLRVLFVGNSYTFYWNLPILVQEMARTQSVEIEVESSTVGGAYWEEHWKGERGLETIRDIRKKKWDIVILQNNSMSAIQDNDKFMLYGEKLVELVKAHGAIPMLFLTWSPSSNPLLQEEVSEAYFELARQTGAEVIPIGPVWEYVKKLRPDLNLYLSDGAHPSNLGAYLTATMMYSFVTKKNTQQIPGFIKTRISTDREIYLNMVMPNNAGFIHDAVDSFLETKSEQKNIN